MFDVYTTGDMAHIDMIFKFWPHMHQHVDVCVTHGAHIEHLYLSKRTFSVSLWL